MDAYAHVNNVEMLRLLEEARIEVFWQHPDGARRQRPESSAHGGARRGTGRASRRRSSRGRRSSTSSRSAYRRAPVVVELWIGHLGGASLDVCYEVRDAAERGRGLVVYARARTTIVLVDAATGSPRARLDARPERAAWSAVPARSPVGHPPRGAVTPPVACGRARRVSAARAMLRCMPPNTTPWNG